MIRYKVLLTMVIATLASGTAQAQPQPIDDPARAPNTPAEKQAAAETAVPTDIGLTFAERKVVQQRLQSDGYYTGDVDGMIGPGTRAAIKEFQKANQLSASGRLTAQTLDVLGVEIAQSPEGALAPTGNESARVETKEEAGSASEATNFESQKTVQLSAMSAPVTRAIQRKLQRLGFYRGEIDGIVGPATRAALSAFYRAQANLVSNDKLLAEGASAFNLNASDIEPVRGEDQSAVQRATEIERD
jgi:peptidoglycan hydrolase-like protein with peptidoglycan-binding domain